MATYQHELSNLLVIPKHEIAIYHVKANGPCTLNREGKIHWEADARLKQMEVRLRKAKSQLDEIPSNEYNRFMGAYDSGMAFKHAFARKHGLVDILITNAWIKMWELLGIFGPPLLETSGGRDAPICAFQVAEAPGSMVIAANHYFVQNGREYDVYFSSLIDPDTSGVSGDKYSLFAKHQGRVIAPETNGDLSNRAVVEAHIALARDKEPTFFTSDLGLTDSSDYSRQEEICLWGHYGAAVTALGCLKKGPSLLILKVFTIFYDLNQSLILFMSTLFKEFAIVKPAASRPANSEIYIVGFGYLGVDPGDLETLLKRLESRDESPLCEADREELIEVIDSITEDQIVHLDFVARHINDMGRVRDSMRGVLEEFTRYFDKYPFLPIAPDRELP